MSSARNPGGFGMRPGIENDEAAKTQRIYARLAGILFLGVILLAFTGGSIAQFRAPRRTSVAFVLA